MSSKIIHALEELFDDLGTIEVATMTDESGSASCESYVKISLDGDVTGFNNTSSEELRILHHYSVKAAIKSRHSLLNFIIQTSKNLTT
jgi:hypothetical protein